MRNPAIPPWVKQQPVELSLPADNDQVGNGIWDLLDDEQSNVREAVFYKHFATKFLSGNGVEDGSKITITYDPDYETLTLNKLVVYRDGKPTDRLTSQDVKLIQREEGLDQQLYDGRLTAVMLLEDIRVGDTVEYAYTIHGVNPIFDGNYFDEFGVRRDTPLRRLYQRLLWPSERKLSMKSHVEDFTPKVTASGSDTEYVWEKNEIPPLISDGDLPSWYEPYNWVQLSEFPTWSDVNRWAMKTLVIPDKAPDNLREEIDRLSPISDPKARALAALRFVQQNIRYLGIEVGAHSHKPYPIDVVLQRRFGDCKDKSLLLCALLRNLGFEAWPALVNTEQRQGISQWLPTAIAFDHCTVQLKLGGRIYWLDPTMSSEGGSLDDLYYPNLGEALVVREGTDSLAKITPGGFDKLGTEITENYVVAGYSGDATLNIHSVYRGLNADGTRSWLADSSHAEIEKNYLNFYAKQYPDIKSVKPPAFADNFEKNEITSDKSYNISHFWQPHSDDSDHLYGDFYPHSIRNLIDRPETAIRSMPLAVAYPVRMTEVLNISLPEGVTTNAEEWKIDDRAFRFTYKRTIDKNKVTLRYTYESLEDHVDAARVPEYLKNINKMIDGLDYEVTCDKEMAGNSPGDQAGNAVAGRDSAPNITPLQRWIILSPFILTGVLWLFWLLRKYYRNSRDNSEPDNSLHKCVLCGRTELSAPDIEFRIARDGEEYCNRHLPKTS